MSIKDNLRLKVESELDLARSKIEAIAKRIDIGAYIPHAGDSTLHVRTESSRAKSKARNMTTNGGDKGASLASYSKGSALSTLPVNDDFRTARHNAFEHLKKLESLGRQVPPTQASSSSAAAPQTTLEVDRQLIDALSKLTDILRRNLRVRYELSVPDIVKVSVILTFVLVGLMHIN
jgi:rapamycin-insensitive companion of mTOR